MTLFVAWIVYPLVLLALCVGVGLLVDALTGRRLAGALLAPVGLAAIVVVGQFTTMSATTARLTVPLLVVLAVAGAVLSRRWRFGRPDPWAAVAAVAVFAVFGAPVYLSGEATFAGFIMLDDTATWLAFTDRILDHGRSLAGLEPSSYLATLDVNIAAGYPVGVFIPFGAAQKLVGTDLAWVFQPYVSFLAAILALTLWQILADLVRSSRLRALAVFIAAQPALLVGYALWGGVKELAAAAFLALAAALAPAVLRRASDIDPTRVGSNSDALRAAVLLALPVAAMLGLLALGGIVWFGPLLLALAALVWRRQGPVAMATCAAAFLAALLVFTVPVVFGDGFSPFQAGLTEETELGNLIAPLDPLQAVGIWPSGDFRVAPDESAATALLIALALLAAAAGLWDAWRRRAAAPLLLGTGLLAAVAIVFVGSPWVDGKALATVAPIALALALAGAIAVLRLDRVAGAALIVALAAGVLWSNVLAYGGASLAPRDHLVELERIGKDFAGEGPTLMTEYNPYGARHFLRQVDGEGASELRVRAVTLRDGGSAEKSESVDVDRIDLAALFEYRTLVLRRSPLRSRPPLPYRLVRAGETYEVWQRPEQVGTPVLSHLPLGGEDDHGAVPDCGEVEELGRQARSGQLGASRGIRLYAAPAAPAYNASDGTLVLPRGGVYEAWLEGSVRGSLELLVDDREFGRARHVLNNSGGFIALGSGHLARGSHHASLRFGGADLHPGSGGFPRPANGALLFTPAGVSTSPGTIASPEAIVSVAPGRAAELCGKRWDWIEAVATG